MAVNPTNNLSVQIAQLQGALANSADPQERQAFLARIVELQAQRNNGNGGDVNSGSQLNNAGIVKSLMDRIRDVASILFKDRSINSPENDSSNYVRAGGQEADLASEAMALGAFEPAGVATLLSGELFEAAATTTEQGIADKKFEKAEQKNALPAQ